jgi:hypothetical protein
MESLGHRIHPVRPSFYDTWGGSLEGTPAAFLYADDDGMYLAILVPCVKLRAAPVQPSAIYPAVVYSDTTRPASCSRRPPEGTTYIALCPLQSRNHFRKPRKHRQKYFIFKELELRSFGSFRRSLNVWHRGLLCLTYRANALKVPLARVYIPNGHSRFSKYKISTCLTR